MEGEPTNPTTVLAGATVLLSIGTFAMALYTRGSARAAQQTVREMQEARSLDWRPHLTAQPPEGAREPSHDDEAQSTRRLVTNIGRGPALTCLIVYHDSAGWSRAEPIFELGPGASVDVVTVPQQPNANAESLWGRGRGARAGHVLTCQDLEERTWYRFLEGVSGVDSWSEGRQKRTPAWVVAAKRQCGIRSR